MGRWREEVAGGLRRVSRLEGRKEGWGRSEGGRRWGVVEWGGGMRGLRRQRRGVVRMGLGGGCLLDGLWVWSGNTPFLGGVGVKGSVEDRTHIRTEATAHALIVVRKPNLASRTCIKNGSPTPAALLTPQHDPISQSLSAHLLFVEIDHCRTVQESAAESADEEVEGVRREGGDEGNVLGG